MTTEKISMNSSTDYLYDVSCKWNIWASILFVFRESSSLLALQQRCFLAREEVQGIG